MIIPERGDPPEKNLVSGTDKRRYLFKLVCIFMDIYNIVRHEDHLSTTDEGGGRGPGVAGAGLGPLIDNDYHYYIQLNITFSRRSLYLFEFTLFNYAVINS